MSRTAAAPSLVAVVALGCTAAIEEGGPAAPAAGAGPERAPFVPAAAPPPAFTAPPPRACGVASVAPTPLRRLGRVEYRNTIHDLLGADGSAADRLGDDERLGPFVNNGSAVDALTASHYGQAARELAQGIAGRLHGLVPCDPAPGDDACARRFVEGFGARVYRRPLSRDEVDGAMEVYGTGTARGGFAAGVLLALEMMLQAPQFLYHLEEGAPTRDDPAVRRLTPHAFASRLSYALWASMPDEALFQAAAAGKLDRPEGIRAEVSRMLAHPRAQEGLRGFFLQWLGASELAALTKDPKLFPKFTAALRRAMESELVDFVDEIVRRGDGKLETLLTSTAAPIAASLGELYGIAAPEPGRPAELDRQQRAGLLTRAGVMAVHAHENQTSPVLRGAFVRENVLCQKLPPPPADVNNTPPEPDGKATTRERFRQHRADPSCAGCHDLIDPVGMAFENYDAIGAWRATDARQPVNAADQLTGTDADGAFANAVDLSARLARSGQVEACVVRQYFRFALARLEGERDACVVASLREAFAKSGRSVRDLVAAVATTEAFRHARVDGK
jgi:hypothetical protein